MKNTVSELISRSNRLGSKDEITNYGGGNTSSKGFAIDPISGEQVSVMWVKGSGGDLGTLKENGLVCLDLERFRSLRRLYKGPEFEDEMVPLYKKCLFEETQSDPSIDTAMHALIPYDHVDHLHPDSIIAIATSSNGRSITKKCFNNKILWIDWKRPGYQLALDIEELSKSNKEAIGVILGGHGLTIWAESSKDCESRSVWAIRTAEKFILETGKKNPLKIKIKKELTLTASERCSKAAEIFPFLRGLVSSESSKIGFFNDSDLILNFMQSANIKKFIQLGTSCPDHFLRTKISPLLIDVKISASLEEKKLSIAKSLKKYQNRYEKYYAKNANINSPPIRGKNPVIFLYPGVGLFSFADSRKEAEIACKFYVNAINVISGAESLSKYRPINEREKFKIEYWSLEENKLKNKKINKKVLDGKVAFVTGGSSGIGKAIVQELLKNGSSVISADKNINLSPLEEYPQNYKSIRVDISNEVEIVESIKREINSFGGFDFLINCAGISISKELIETTTHDWDSQNNLMSRGSFLCSREIAKIMIDQGIGGHIVYIVSKNSVFAGANNVAYGAAKASQSHQVRLLAAELGKFGIQVNGVNPDGVVKGSGIFSSGWGANRAKVYGIQEKDLGKYYANRTLLGLEVDPEDIAAAVHCLISGSLSKTTGLHIPVDAGVAAAFLR